MSESKVVVFCPNPCSLYTTAVCELLLCQGITLSAIFVRRFSVSRFASEFRRDGSRLLVKIWKKLILRESAYRDNEPSILSVRKSHGIKTRNVSEFRHRNGVELLPCGSFNDPLSRERLQQLRPNLVVFTGGGLIRKHILEVAGDGIINCHMGILPRYRGMDVVEWAALEGSLDHLGCTTHFMDTGIDTGDILLSERIDRKVSDSLASLRNRVEAMMPELMVRSVVGYLGGTLKRGAQHVGAGRQYFTMHRRLRELAAKRLAEAY